MKEAKCQYCHRVLAKIDDSGDLTISGRTTMDFGFTIPREILLAPKLSEAIDGIPQLQTATCLLWKCRFKRWLAHD